jgi:hypothetical protein
MDSSLKLGCLLIYVFLKRGCNLLLAEKLFSGKVGRSFHIPFAPKILKKNIKLH